jgi:predicted GNAT family acetyltransferase
MDEEDFSTVFFEKKILQCHSLQKKYSNISKNEHIRILSNDENTKKLAHYISLDVDPTYGSFIDMWLAESNCCDNKIYVYVKNRKPVSYAFISLEEDDKMYISFIYTINDCKRKGYSIRLIKEIIKNEKRNLIYAHSTNFISDNFFKKIGFTEKGDTYELATEEECFQ